MTPDVVVYVSSVANAHRHPRKVACLESFALGAKAVGASTVLETATVYRPARLAVILGWALDTTRGGPNISLRKQIIAEQQRRGAHTMCIDASCFKYLDNHSHYLRYSIGGPYYDQANYANRNSNSSQWQRISNDLGVELKPPVVRDQGHILICMQRDGGFAMKQINPMVWLDQKIQQIRNYTNRSIVIRPHPGAYQVRDFAHYSRQRDITVVDPGHCRLTDNLQDAQSAVFFNSSASVAAVCAGVPVFVDDSSCVAWAVANKNIADINEPLSFEREQWLWDLAAAHWSDRDSQQGLIYQKFVPYLT